MCVRGGDARTWQEQGKDIHDLLFSGMVYGMKEEEDGYEKNRMTLCLMPRYLCARVPHLVLEQDAARGQAAVPVCSSRGTHNLPHTD